MKVIKIDVVNKTITEIQIEKGIAAIYKELDCQTFTCIELPNGDALYIDDEGLLLDEPLGAFTINGMAQPLSGHGLIIGTNHKTGESKDCKSSVELITRNIKFVPVQLLKGVPLDSDFIPLNEKELDEFMRTGNLPIGKIPPSKQ